MEVLLLFLVGFITQASSQQKGWTFDFANNGYDFDQAIPPNGWQGVNHCGEPERQSPINLMNPLDVYGWFYGLPIPAEFDKLRVGYLNPKKGSQVLYEDHNFQMVVNQFEEADINAGRTSLFESSVPSMVYNCEATKFPPISFHFHHPSEHPVNGYHRDIAFHLVHSLEEPKAENIFRNLAIGVQFSVDDYDRSISEEEIAIIHHFFDSLDMSNRANSVVDSILGVQQIEFEEFMSLIDFAHSWIYSGSGAFPPCTKAVIWRIPTQLYPIKLLHMYQIRQIFLDHEHQLKSKTNIRGIHKVNGHEVRYIGGFLLQFEGAALLVILSIVLL